MKGKECGKLLISLLNLVDEENQEKFTDVYKTYKNLMFSIAKNYINDDEYAEDCVLDAFIDIGMHFYQVGDVLSSRTRNYVSVIVKTAAMKKFNKESRSIPVDEIEIDEIYKDYKFTNTEDEFFRNQTTKNVHKAINQLEDMYKFPILLKNIYGYKSKDIAKLTGLSDDVVRKRISYAKQKIKVILEREMENNE